MLMGGQACVFYGAAEFSRDLDLLILVDDGNLGRLQASLAELDARPIAVPELDPSLLERGHAVHFRCGAEGVESLRIDLMSKLRGVDEFEDLWARRTTIEGTGGVIDMLGLEDLVRAKKTQRDKDWPMIRRLVEVDYFRRTAEPSARQMEFWLREARSPELLVEVAAKYRSESEVLAGIRVAVAVALTGNLEQVEAALLAEEQEERRRDRAYWQPLKKELEDLRRARLRGESSQEDRV